MSYGKNDNPLLDNSDNMVCVSYMGFSRRICEPMRDPILFTIIVLIIMLTFAVYMETGFGLDVSYLPQGG